MKVNAPKMNIIFLSEDLEKLYTGAQLACIAATSGMVVNIFVTMNALAQFQPDVIANQKPSGTAGERLIDAPSQSFYDLLRSARKLGVVHLFGCSHTMDLMGYSEDMLVPEIEQIETLPAFFCGAAERGQITVV